ncbi:hypothetical protein M0R45_006880 [Rubus argutus]|uniref:Cytochrome b5 heme-binding domain-containing protein n=1 Tax=Rubus argutus TaxID=59490 RepID=A0AAW1YSG2_RUBAR
MGIYEVVMEEMTRYTGLSPAAFFTIAGMMVVVYRYVTGMFVVPDEYNKPPCKLGDMTEQELRGYDGSDPNKPLLMAIKAQIYDVSSSRNFYGPGGPYAMFAGRDASRALALLSFKPQDINGNIQGWVLMSFRFYKTGKINSLKSMSRLGSCCFSHSHNHNHNHNQQIPNKLN